MNDSDLAFNFSTYLDEYRDIHTILWTLIYAADYLPIALGIVPNLWLLLAIVTSEYIRSRMRNKIICSICVLHLLSCLLLMPMKLKVKHLNSIFEPVNCYFYIAVTWMTLMEDFITNWSLVILVVVFVAQVCDCRPHSRFSNTMVVFGTSAVVGMPWVASFITVTAISASSYELFWEHHNISSSHSSSCYFAITNAFSIIKSLDAVVALLTAVVLLGTAVVLRRRQVVRGRPSGALVALTDRGPEIDDHYGYTAAVTLTIVCDIPDVLFLELIDYNLFSRLIFMATSYFLSQSKVFLSPLPWLLFPDIRKRIKTWRPGHRPRSDTDTVMLTNVHS